MYYYLLTRLVIIATKIIHRIVLINNRRGEIATSVQVSLNIHLCGKTDHGGV